MHRFARLWIVPLVALFLTASQSSGFAQTEGDEFKIGTWREVESKVLGETRKIIVSKPDNYDATDDRYCVLYLLDGDSHFHHTTGLIDFMVSNESMPETIVVAVTNTDRTRDLTPKPAVKDEASPTAGGADNFARFFKEELIPFVDENYRTRPYRILVGHSYGGLFAVHTLVHHPDLFDAYIAISPSFQWDDQRLVGQAQKFFQESKELPKSLYMTVGNEGWHLHGGLLKVAGSLKARTPPKFEWDTRIMEEESHGTVPYRSTRQGLEFIFKDWSLRDPLPLYEIGGVSAVLKHYETASAKYGIESRPNDALMNLVARLNFTGRANEARAVLEHDTEKFPPPGMLYSTIGKTFMEKSEKEPAIACYTKALKLNPADNGARSGLKELGVDPDSIVKPVSLSKEQLAVLVGTYDYPMRDEDKVTISVVDGKLVGQIRDQPKVEMTPASDLEFVEGRGYYRFVFERDEDQSIKQLTIKIYDGTSVACPRLPE